MKKAILYMSLLALASCQSISDIEREPAYPSNEYILALESDALDITTKATAVTSMPSSLYWAATTGTSGTSDAQKYAPTSTAVSSSKIATGKYQTDPYSSYNWYVSNSTFTIKAGGPTIAASNSTDIVSGVAKAQSTTTPSVTLNHIFARTGSLTLTSSKGYNVSDVSWTIKSSGSSSVSHGGTAGTFNMASDSWTGITTYLSSATALTSSSDMYLIPAKYSVTINYTLSKGDFSKSYQKTGSATLVKGQICNLSASVSDDDAQPITIAVSLTAWTTGNVDVAF